MNYYSFPALDRITGIICYSSKLLYLLRLQSVILCLFYSVQLKLYRIGMVERDKPTPGASRQELHGGGVPLRPLLKQKAKPGRQKPKMVKIPLNSIYTSYPIVNPLNHKLRET